ncbi:MAG: MFS transporter [Rhodobiaceae bacterium]|nr:MFS transporter [Rhodobiaceae bacterium]MCC0049619.1 MFS transporter [Rhodobiaceae bacterium]
MSQRWTILALLFGVRVTMAFQFQAVAALSPYIMEYHGVGLADIGLLIGLYLSPGIVIAMPGGAIGKRFGDKQAVAFGMALMLAGGIMMIMMPGWYAQVGGRLIAGTGGVILNVLMSKMVTDWFRDGGLATAMGIFVNSWPVGIALALLVLPPIAEASGLAATMGLVVTLVGAGLAALVAVYRDPPQQVSAAAVPTANLRGVALTGVVLAGSIWGLYNTALGMIFGFGPAMLVERGWSPTEASSTTSVVLWLVALSVPLGGFLADRTGSRDMILIAGLLGFALLMAVAPGADWAIATFIALGLVGGLAAGPIMSLPAAMMQPHNRAFGMGVFFTIYYLCIFAGPVVAGTLAETFGNAGVTFSFGAALLVFCGLCLAAFRRLEQRPAALAAASQ